MPYKDPEVRLRYQRKYQETRGPYARTRRLQVRGDLSRIKSYAGCLHCDERDERCLDFHHIDSSNKMFNLGNLGDRSVDSIIKETNKCVVICANCHRKLHAGDGALNLPERSLIQNLSPLDVRA